MTTIERILDRLTLDQKIAQLQGLTPYELIPQAGAAEIPEDADIDLSAGIPYDLALVPERRPHGVGHFSLIWTVDADLDRLRGHVDTLQRHAAEVNPFGIGTLIHGEAVNGLVHDQADQFATPWGQAATWDPSLSSRLAEHAVRQARALDISAVFSPVLDVARDIRWGRVHETYGEDPELITRMGLGFIRGIHGPGGDSGVFATGKHFLGYGSSIGALNQAGTQLGRRELRDVYAEPFRRAIAEAGLQLVMNSYNEIDGVPAAANSWLLRDLLRDELGFGGLVVSDYDSIAMLWKTQRVAATPADAAVQALTAGIDVELPGNATTETLRDRVEAGDISERVIDEAVLRVLRLKADLGLVPDMQPRTPIAAPIAVDHDEAAALSREVAASAITLLANDGTLPLDARATNIAVTGPAADAIRIHFGSYSSVANQEMPLAMGQIMAGAVPGVEPSLEVFTDIFQVRLPGIDPLFEASARALHSDAEPLVKALQRINPSVEHHPFGSIEENAALDETEIASAFANADTVIVAVGERTGWVGTHTAGEGRTAADPSLPGNQGALIELLARLGKRVITVLVSGRPLLIEPEHEASAAVLLGPLLGPAAGPALADALFGIREPEGRLPSTFPRHLGQLPLYHGHPIGSGYDHPTLHRFGYTDLPDSTPLYAFGHGLGYTTFDTDLVEATVADGHIVVRASVTNTGDRAGTTVVQLYGRDELATVVRPVRQLLDFHKVTLGSAESADIEFRVPLTRLEYTLPDGTRGLEPGEVTLMLALASDDVRATARVEAP
ncbi:glycoside hydrolase family 3 N-terminal domain-containing protein [Brachybacterium paraconglomeratum]|uniref:glycoside hydrolase family 3 N-terminal domain-containing protein n=1 Tax=Brachybacterium paraconglomeratum TaxID=173362 RepID=UPI0037CC54CF